MPQRQHSCLPNRSRTGCLDPHRHRSCLRGIGRKSWPPWMSMTLPHTSCMECSREDHHRMYLLHSRCTTVAQLECIVLASRLYSPGGDWLQRCRLDPLDSRYIPRSVHLKMPPPKSTFREHRSCIQSQGWNPRRPCLQHMVCIGWPLPRSNTRPRSLCKMWNHSSSQKSDRHDSEGCHATHISCRPLPRRKQPGLRSNLRQNSAGG